LLDKVQLMPGCIILEVNCHSSIGAHGAEITMSLLRKVRDWAGALRLLRSFSLKPRT
jgi:hypothetical protein